jgi:hypothetical protein
MKRYDINRLSLYSAVTRGAIEGNRSVVAGTLVSELADLFASPS